MKIDDERSEEQEQTHIWAVLAHDTFLSGWGRCKGGKSMIAWAMPPEWTANAGMGWRMKALRQWAEDRSDMRNVRVVYLPDYRPGRGVKHFSIVPVNKKHPSQNQQPSNERQEGQDR